MNDEISVISAGSVKLRLSSIVKLCMHGRE